MSQYASLTVAQLKEALKEKGLAVDGKKADLVARLAEAESAGGELDDEPSADGSTSESKPQEPASGEPETAGPVSTEAAGEDGGKGASVKPEKKPMSPEERKQLAVDLLTKKLKRAEKFGDEASATAARKDLARVEKFGVDPSTALAKEIGALDRTVNSELSVKKFPKKKGKKTGKGKGKKVQK